MVHKYFVYFLQENSQLVLSHTSKIYQTFKWIITSTTSTSNDQRTIFQTELQLLHGHWKANPTRRRKKRTKIINKFILIIDFYFCHCWHFVITTANVPQRSIICTYMLAISSSIKLHFLKQIWNASSRTLSNNLTILF